MTSDIQAWKDPSYRRSLGAAAPDHPSGAQQLDDRDLDGLSAAGTNKLTTHGCCNANLTISTACSLVCAATYFLC